MRSRVEKKMTLEEYVDYFNSGKSIDFTWSYLNQILHMHGFRKLHHSNKVITNPIVVEILRKQRTVGEAVDAVELLDLSRSTLNQNAVSSSSASLTLDQVITDIESLKWQECRLTSLKIINSDEVTGTVTNPKQRLNKRKKQGNEKKMTTKKKKKKNVKSISDL